MTGLARELVTAAVVVAFYILIFIAADLAHRRLSLAAEVTRKIGHVAAGLLALALPALALSHWTVLLLGVLFFAALWISRSRGIMRSIRSVARETHGELFFPLALALTYLLASVTGTFHFYPIAILALALGDPAAWLVGSSMGRHHYTILGDRRSLEGSLALAVTGTAIVLIFSALASDLRVAPLPTAIAAGVVMAMLEAVSPRGTDNLTIPLGTWGVLMLAS